MISTFINRETELSLLAQEWNKQNGQLIILYGRRRIGKTRLVTEFLKDKLGIFYIGEDTSYQIQLNGLKMKIAEFLNDDLLTNLEIKNWDQLFEYFTRNLPKKRFYFFIDEFSYLIKSDKGILSTLQKYWDTVFSSSNMFLVLCGSILGLMSERVLSYASPLYGRRSRGILLTGIKFKHAMQFLSMPFTDMLQVYMTTGGVPEYLLKATPYHSFDEFINAEFVNKNGYFYREPHYIISQEFKELKTYFSILNAIAYGNTMPTKIANFSGLKAREIYPYLENLIRLGFVKRNTSIFGSTKNGIYMISDPIFDFWFNFVFKHREQIEREVFQVDTNLISRFFGKKFESFVLNEWIPLLYHSSETIGRWWYKDQEIDGIIHDKKRDTVTFLECKWMALTTQQAQKILKDLEDKSYHVKLPRTIKEKKFGIVARSIPKKNTLRKLGIIVLDLEDLQSTLDNIT